MKKTVSILFFILLTTISVAHSQSKKEVVYMRIQEVITSASIDSYLRIIYPDKPSKLVELSTLGKNGKMSEENGKKIQMEISAIINEGYDLTSSSVAGDVYSTTTIIIFTK